MFRFLGSVKIWYLVPMSSGLSIITAIHNGLPMNQLFWECLSQHTSSPFELIIIDNHSTDGSEKYFQKLQDECAPGKEIIYVRNQTNQSYPASQIQGMTRARFSILCFLNNDIWLPPNWHEPFESALEKNSLLVLSPSGQEAQPSQRASNRLKRRWRQVSMLSRIWKILYWKKEYKRLKKSLEWMYGDINHFRSPTPSLTISSMNGIKGDAVVLHRDLLEHIPNLWDERVEAADWHLYLTVASLHAKDPSIPLPQILLNSYVHHFGRYSAGAKREPFPKTFLSLDEIWGRDTIQRLWWGYQLPE